MAANNGDLMQHLIEGGISPVAARVIANALANASSPQFSGGNDRVDSTPKEQLRLVTPDARRYQLTNLDYSPAEPFQRRISENLGAYAGGAADHPYKDSQPVSPTPPLAQPSVVGKDYISVKNIVERNSSVSEVSLDLRLDVGGRHIRLDPSTKSLESVPFIARPEVPRYLASEFRETENGTELVHGLRNLAAVDAVLSDGSTRLITAFSENDAVANNAFGGWGSWTPGLYNGTTPVTATYSTRYGRYFRIGKLVLVYGELKVVSITSPGATIGVRIGPLPFEVVNRTAGCVANAANWAAGGVPANTYVQKAASANGGNYFFLRTTPLDANAVQYQHVIPDNANGSQIAFAAFYETTGGTVLGAEDIVDTGGG